MIRICKSEDQDMIILKCNIEEDRQDWIGEKLKDDDSFTFKKTFELSSKSMISVIHLDFGGMEYHFKLAELRADREYYQIDKGIFGLNNEFYISKEMNIDKSCFLAPDKISILRQIDKLVEEDIHIGGEASNSIPSDVYFNMLQHYPNTYEITLYRQARVTSIIRDFVESTLDKEKVYKKYRNKKELNYSDNVRKQFKDSEILKYETLIGKLKSMLNDEEQYSEKRWQEEILQILILLFPRYISAFPELNFRDTLGKKRSVDFGLVDFNGNLDLLEIKTPFEKPIMSISQYRDNHVPLRDLSGAIMQIEKYIYNLNKAGVSEEKRLTKKYKEFLPENLEIKITNPRGMIIMGRSDSLSSSQKTDFEIIKRKYRNIADIFTYDELILRMEVLVKQIRNL